MTIKDEFEKKVLQLLEEAHFYDIEFLDDWGTSIKVEFSDSYGSDYSMNFDYNIKDDKLTVTNIYYTYLKNSFKYIIKEIKEWDGKKVTALSKLGLFIKCSEEINKVNNEISSLQDIASAFKNDDELEYIYDILIKYKKKVDTVMENVNQLIESCTTIAIGE